MRVWNIVALVTPFIFALLLLGASIYFIAHLDIDPVKMLGKPYFLILSSSSPAPPLEELQKTWIQGGSWWGKARVKIRTDDDIIRIDIFDYPRIGLLAGTPDPCFKGAFIGRNYYPDYQYDITAYLGGYQVLYSECEEWE